jgi:hypothetical protein
MEAVSPELLRWVCEALELGLGCLSDGDHAPFVLLQLADGQRHLLNLEEVSGVINEELVDLGRELIQGFEDGEIYGVVFDGYLTSDSGKQDAVFIEAGRRQDAHAFIFAQPYKPRKRRKALACDGGIVNVREVPNLWSPHQADES